MSSIRYWLPPFDPAADYVVAAWPQGFSIGGYQPKAGEPFDKTAIKRRNVLEELYIKRWIALAEPVRVTALPPQPGFTGENVDTDDDWKDNFGALPGLLPPAPRRRRTAATAAD
ncbi:hypothetical protein H8A97_13025 [Bradyrhizobium sp. Arg62]|uniref:hypothetical protein n=1 Tax=Bradyrhizobium brasilense TaxID=1419277 RepID=UPI001E637AB3|nr:hypothetical protein [Bradyrhizobium brasilense]MCC8945996.1 hypothetical protein [Bradyrhizobium brasilense]